MATWIKVEGGLVISTTVTPANGRSFTLKEMQRYVGGYIEPLPLRDGRILWLNEEGKLDELPYNPVADQIAHEGTGIAWNDGIVGDVLIATREESGENDDEEEK